MSNAKVRQRRRRRNKRATEWWHIVVHGRLILMPPGLRRLRGDPALLELFSYADPKLTAALYPEAP